LISKTSADSCMDRGLEYSAMEHNTFHPSTWNFLTVAVDMLEIKRIETT